MSVAGLRFAADTEPVYSVRVPTAAGWLNANDRGSWHGRHHLVAQWRRLAGWAAIREKVPTLTRAYVGAELRFPDRRHRDPANWYPTVKACVDGLVDVGVFPGDWSFHVIGPDMRQGPPSPKGARELHLHLWPVTGDE